ncbi:nSTAND1 domain-containing NTPase [Nostoc sp.]|uniref:nSTAND1 domain-containing NTPase n=1 Tax=Nostoc sp. TaxID=1180 RepID=UPI002FF9C9F9
MISQTPPSPTPESAQVSPPSNPNHETQTTKWFDTTHVLAIGINRYKQPIDTLENAVNDAIKIYDLFDEKCLLSGESIKRYKLLDQEATFNAIHQQLKTLTTEVKLNDRLIFYYAGHGIALHSQEAKDESLPKTKNKPRGYLIPYDAEMEGRKNYLSMDNLLDWLSEISCRHCLIILDCCYAGSIQWSLDKTREALLDQVYPTVLDNYIDKNAWFILTSSDENETANDGEPIELNPEQQLTKKTRGLGKTSNSPFVRCLHDALVDGKADIYPEHGGDKIITTVELEAYLGEVTNTTSQTENRQTPQRFKVPGKHGGGEFVFLLNDIEAVKKQLPEDPDVTADHENNPYRGLESFREEDKNCFFGRNKVTEELFHHVCKHPLTVVVGTSGVGKSSLVKAGLIPKFQKESNAENNEEFNAENNVDQMRPGQSPADLLQKKLEELNKLPNETKRLLIIDQLEEIETQCADEKQKKAFWSTLIEQSKSNSKNLYIVLTLRADFEATVRGKFEAAKNYNQSKTKKSQSNSLGNPEFTLNWSRFIVPAMERHELKEAIEKPAKEKAVFFTSEQDPEGKIQPRLVEHLVDQVAGMPGALALLSFALYTMYRNFAQRYVKSNKTIKREITWDDYKNLGDNGVLGSVTRRADEEFNNLQYKLNKVEENDKSLLKVVKDQQGKGVPEEVKIAEARQEMLKWVMLRMVSLDDGQVARRRVLKTELKYDERYNLIKSEQLDLVIQLFDQARLLVQGNTEVVSEKVENGQITQETEKKEYVEPAHDALITNWERLREWIKQENENIILRERVIPDINDWQKLKNNENPSNWHQHIFNALGKGFDCTVEQLWVRCELKRLNNQEKKNAKPKKSFAASKHGHSSSDDIKFAQKAAETASENLPSNESNTTVEEKAPPQTDSNNTQHIKSSDRLWDKESRLEVLGQQLGKLRTHKDSWLNKTEADFVLQSLIKREKSQAGMIIGLWIFVGILLLLTARVFNEHRNTLVEQVRTSRQSAEANLQANRDLEALTDILRARKTFDNGLISIPLIGNSYLKWVKWGTELEQTQVRGTLYKAIYATKERNRLQLDRAVINSVAFHPKKDLLAIAANRGTIRLFNSAGKQMETFPAGPNVSTLAFTPDGNWLATGGGNIIKLWKVGEDGVIETSNPLNIENKLQNYDVRNISFPPSNKQETEGSGDYKVQMATVNLIKNSTDVKYKVQIWELQISKDKQAKLQAKLILKSETNEKQSSSGVAFRPTNNKEQPNQIVTVDDHNKITLWKTANDKLTLIKTINTHQTNVHSIAFNKDGNLATGGEDNTVKFWKIEGQGNIKKLIPLLTGQQQVFQTPPKNIYGMAFDANDKLAIFGEDNAVTLLNNSGKIDNLIQPQDTYVNDAIAGNMAYSPDGENVAVIAGENTIRLWNLKSSKQLLQFSIPTDKYGNAISLAFSPSGKEFAVGTKNGYITLWNTSGEFLNEVHTQWNVNEGVPGKGSSVQMSFKNQAIQRIIFSLDSTRLAVFGESGDLGYLSFEKPNTQHVITGRPEFKQVKKTDLGKIKDVVFDSRFNKLLSIDSEQNFNVQFRNKQSASPQKVKTQQNFNVQFRNRQSASPQKVKTQANSVAFSPNDSFFATAGKDGKVKLWEFNNLDKPFLEFDTHQKNIKSIVFNPKNSNDLLTGGEDGTVRLWNIFGNKPTQLLVERYKPDHLAISSDGKLMATLNNKQLLMWERGEQDYFTQKNISETKLAQGKNYTYISFMPNSNRLLTIEKDSNVKLWDSEGEQFVLIKKNITKQQPPITWTEDGKVLATFGEINVNKSNKKSETVKLWDFQDNKFQQRILADTELEKFQKKVEITSVALSFDGKKLATAERSIGRIKLWDVSSDDKNKQGKIINQFQTQQGEINNIAFSPDGKRLVTVGGEKKTLRLWDVSGDPLDLIQEDEINHIIFSPDGKLLAGVKNDSQLMVWDVSGDKFNPLYGQKLDQKFGVEAFEFSANELITLGQEDSKVSQWQINEEQLLDQACGLVQEYLKNNPNVAESDRHLCDGIDKIKSVDKAESPSIQPTIINSSDTKGKELLRIIAKEYYHRGEEKISPDQINKQPKSAEDYTNRGINKFRSKNSQDPNYINSIINDYNTVINNYSKTPKPIEAYVNRGITYSTRDHQNDQNLAIQDYNKAIELDSQKTDVYISRGIAYAALGKLDKAIDDYNTAINIKPNDNKTRANGYFAMGLTLATLRKEDANELTRALEAYTKAKELYKIELKKAKPEDKKQIQSYLSRTQKNINYLESKLRSNQ